MNDAENTWAALIEELAALREEVTRLRQGQATKGEREGFGVRVLESSISGIYVYDVDGRRTEYVNPRYTRITGWTMEEINSMTEKVYDALIHPEERRAVSEHMEAVRQAEDGRVLEIEYRFRTKEAGWIWCLSWDTAYDRNPEGRIKRYIGMVVDITDRVKAEKELREEEERFLGFFDTITEYCYMVSPEGLILDVNSAALDALGYERDELLGKPLPMIYAPESLETMKAAFAAWKQTGKVRDTELVVLTKDKQRRTVILNATGVRDAEGALRHTISVQHDITERKRGEEDRLRMEQQIQQTQRLESLGVLAGGIAHDFNNILMVIIGHADLALSELPAFSPGRESISQITEAARRGADLCTQMLAYSGKGRFVKQDISLLALIEDMLHMLKTCISKKALLNMRLEKGLPRIHGDTSQIRQVLMNLVLNSSEAIGERSGMITISTGAVDCPEEYFEEDNLAESLSPGLFIYVEVSDTGRGMDKATRERIFEPFFTTKFTGRGLGLSAVLGIVRAHGGALRVYSEIGKGTTFKVLFPAVFADSEPENDQSGKEDSNWRGKGTVMLVDDEETVRAISGKLLRHMGLEVLTAEDGRRAVGLYRERRNDIDLVLLDLTMPRMNGEEAYRELRRIDPQVQVVLASGYGEEDVSTRFAGKGLAGVLQKPYTIAGLRKLLSGLLPEANSQSEERGGAR